MAKKHEKYYIDGKEVPSVTTILSILSKPELEKWYGKLGLKEATRQRDEAAAFGSLVHTSIEAIYSLGKSPILPDSRLKSTVNNFKIWADRRVKKWIAFEKAIYNDVFLYAGTLDCIAELYDGKIALIDIKTSRSVREEHKLQVIAYYNATRIEDQILDLSLINKILIVHLNHNTLEWEEHEVEPSQELFDVFKCCVELYKWKNKTG